MQLNLLFQHDARLLILLQLTFDMIPKMPLLEHLILWMNGYRLFPQPTKSGTEDFGPLKPLRTRCPRLTCIQIPDSPIQGNWLNDFYRKRENGWEVRFLALGAGYATWLPTRSGMKFIDTWEILSG